VVMDGVNGFYYEHPKMKNENHKVIPHTQLVIYHAFREFFKSDWVNICLISDLKVYFHSNSVLKDLNSY